MSLRRKEGAGSIYMMSLESEPVIECFLESYYEQKKGASTLKEYETNVGKNVPIRHRLVLLCRRYYGMRSNKLGSYIFLLPFLPGV